MLDVFIGANCLVGFWIKKFLLLGQDSNWDWLVFYILKSLDEFKGWISLTNAKRGLPLKRHFDWTSESPIPPEIESQPQSVKWTCIRKCKNITKWSKNVRILTTLAWTTWILICHIPTYYYLFKTKSLCHASLGFGPALASSNLSSCSSICFPKWNGGFVCWPKQCRCFQSQG